MWLTGHGIPRNRLTSSIAPVCQFSMMQFLNQFTVALFTLGKKSLMVSSHQDLVLCGCKLKDGAFGGKDLQERNL